MIHVAVIIPTWNNCQRLAVTLDAIAACRIPSGLRWEVIVVANNCTDATKAVALPFSERLPLVYLEESRQGASNARNTGINAARGELIIFADDDVRPCVDWIGAYWGAFRECGPTFYLGGPLRNARGGFVDPDLLPFMPAISVRHGLDLGKSRRCLLPGECFAGANWACPAAIVRAAGGFDPTLGLDGSLGRRRVGEDRVLFDHLDQMGLSGLYLPNALVTHFVPEHKCSLRWAGQHWRAHGLFSTQTHSPNPYFNSSSWLRAWLGEQQWTARAIALTCLATVAAAVRWLAARSLRRKGYEEFVRMQFCIGRLDAYRLWVFGRFGTLLRQ